MLAALSLAAGLGAVGLGLLPASTAPDWQDGACPPDTGTTVVVQATDWTEVRCALGDFESALEATHQAGFVTEYVPNNPGMVCVINAFPTPCNGAPAGAYWSLWLAQASQWRYASQGASSQSVAVNDWVGWAFGAGTSPDLAPSGGGAAPKEAPLASATSSSTLPASTTASGSPWPAAVGVGLILLVAGAAWLVVRRRR